MPAPLIIDAAGIPYMDSAGLGALIGIFASCQRTGQKFAISSVPERVQVLFDMTGVKGMLPCFGSLEEAEADVIAHVTHLSRRTHDWPLS